jgi:hypothetical protein
MYFVMASRENLQFVIKKKNIKKVLNVLHDDVARQTR